MFHPFLIPPSAVNALCYDAKCYDVRRGLVLGSRLQTAIYAFLFIKGRAAQLASRGDEVQTPSHRSSLKRQPGRVRTAHARNKTRRGVGGAGQADTARGLPFDPVRSMPRAATTNTTLSPFWCKRAHLLAEDAQHLVVEGDAVMILPRNADLGESQNVPVQSETYKYILIYTNTIQNIPIICKNIQVFVVYFSFLLYIFIFWNIQV